ncbi:putative membrane protein [Streptomyces scabiei 87.22]|uniref:Putative membrane protein n=8 Tax=Streptomyces TaxID=1883 RepID=C9ZER0_STRSW|nr:MULTISPECIES: phage holin family protein [Streptomyces]MDW8476972.1 phage holin family protein [Streptomyces scabiei]MDX2579245.1 phage holin family protein [Streptomyces scabiei]MDX2652256.1 phage holin family protein [Streptomyces scabiei]MDX2888644.1 phage holin family protein [Streptomyces scabiei]MDX3139522.1 phage holin family protein [Streptomyces scabiei]
MLAVWAVSTLTMLVLAGALPDFRLQSESGESATQIAVTAALGAGAFGLLSALVWPLLVRALLLVPALVLGLLVFFLNGSLLLLALRISPSGQGEAAPETAVVVAAVMSAVASATGGALAVRDDDAYRRRLYRLADRRRRTADGGPGPAGPGTVFLQFDGVGHDVLEAAVEKGLMPTVAAWLGHPADGAARPRPTHRLTPWRTDWSSQTGASQLGILHGSNHDVPAFRWYEKDTREVMVCNRPSGAAELQRRAVDRTGDGGLLTVDGASRGNLFSGGAEQLALVLSIAARRGRRTRSRAGYFAYFSDPANAVRTAMSFVADVLRETGQSTRARFARQRPRVKRGGLYPFIRAFATVVERDVVVAAVIGDMFAGRAAIYADLVAYDEVAHHSGPHSRDAAQVLERLDRSLALIAQVAGHAPRAYRIVLLSDHGQSPGETFLGRYGLTLGNLVRAGCGLPVPRRARRTHSGAEARTAVRAALRIPGEERVEEHRATRRSEPVVLASGNLGLVSFPDVPHRMSREEIDARHPALLSTLANHPGIGFVLVRSEEHGGVVLGAHGAEVPVGELSDEHPGPLADFGPGAAAAVRRTHGFPHTADIMVNSWYDPAEGEVHAFEEQIGSHGGLGGCQSRPFLMSPLALSEPTGDGEDVVGAEHVHRVLRRWLREADGPQVPLAEPGAPVRGAGGRVTSHEDPAPVREQNPADA